MDDLFEIKLMVGGTYYPLTIPRKDEASYKTVFSIRQYQQHLGFSESWMSEYAFNTLMLAKKEPRKKEDLEAAREMLRNR